MQTGKPCAGHKNFLGLTFTGFGREEDHVQILPPIRRQLSVDTKLVKKAQILAAQGLTTAAIATQLNIPKTTAHRYINRRTAR